MLNRLPEVKHFLLHVVQPGEYERLTVNFISGRVPELVLYGDDGAELERMFVDKLSGHELHTLVQSKGFARAKPTS